MVLVYKSQGFINHYLSLQAVSDDLFVKKSGQNFKCFANHLKKLDHLHHYQDRSRLKH